MGDMLYEVYKDAKAPFWFSGCKVSDSYGTMLVLLFKIHSFANFSWGNWQYVATFVSNAPIRHKIACIFVSCACGDYSKALGVMIWWLAPPTLGDCQWNSHRTSGVKSWQPWRKITGKRPHYRYIGYLLAWEFLVALRSDHSWPAWPLLLGDELKHFSHTCGFV